MVDKELKEIASLDRDDPRKFTIAVAGPCALLVAKLHKVGERSDKAPNRLQNKDASDLYLLLRETRTEDLVPTFGLLLENPDTSMVVLTALHYLRDLFAAPEGAGLSLLRDAVAGLGDEETTAASCQALADELLRQLDLI